MTKGRFAGLVPLSLSALVTFWVWLTPLNKYAWDGPTSIPPDADTVFMLVLLSTAGVALAMFAVWRCRFAPDSHVRWSLRAGAILIALYDVIRFVEAVPHFEG